MVPVVAGPEVVLVVFDDVQVAALRVLPRHDLDLLLGLESLRATVERNQVLFLSYRVLQLALLLGDRLLEQLSLEVVDVAELRLLFLMRSSLDREIVLDRVRLVLLRDQCDSLHLLLRGGRLLLLILLCRHSCDHFGLALLLRWILVIRHLELPLDVSGVYLGTLKHLEVVDWDVGLGFDVQVGLAALFDDASHTVLANVAPVEALTAEAPGSVPHLQRVNGLFAREPRLAREEGALLHGKVLLFSGWVQGLIVTWARRDHVGLELSLSFEHLFDCQSDWILDVVP